MLPRLSNNTDLPELNGFAARSTWLILIGVLFAAASAVGIDLGHVLGEMGIGATPMAVLASGERAIDAWQLIAPQLLGIWAWVERRAPKYRLVWPWSRSAALPPAS
jgi:hypothetical protein